MADEGADISEFLNGLGEAAQRQLAAAVQATEEFGEHVIGDAQQLTPVLTGALKASGTTTEAELDGDFITKEMGFNMDYSAAVHEVLDNHHEQGQAKYLEAAMRQNAPKYGPFVAARTKAAAGGQ